MQNSYDEYEGFGFEFDYANITFEWDNEKEEANFRKHGIKFRTASKVFADENKLIRYDSEHSSQTESRYDVLGKIGKVLFVVCVFRDNNVVRLISARLANAAEKERYENGND